MPMFFERFRCDRIFGLHRKRLMDPPGMRSGPSGQRQKLTLTPTVTRAESGSSICGSFSTTVFSMMFPPLRRSMEPALERCENSASTS